MQASPGSAAPAAGRDAGIAEGAAPSVMEWSEAVALFRRYELGVPAEVARSSMRSGDVRALRRLVAARRRIRALAGTHW